MQTKKAVSALRISAYALLFATVLLISVAAILIYRLFFSNWLSSSETLTVPDLVGQSIASVVLPDTARTVRIDRFDRAPVGTILAQHPAPGSERRVIPGKHLPTVTLYVSKGKERIAVPDVRGLDLPGARVTLLQSGFAVRVTEQSGKAENGTVIGQSPACGTLCTAGDTVTVTVSRGERNARVRVPDLTGLSRVSAESLLQSCGLKAGRIAYRPSDGAEGRVLSQLPNALTHLPAGASVDLVLSCKEPPVTAPSAPEIEEIPESESADEHKKDRSPTQSEHSVKERVDQFLNRLFPSDRESAEAP